MPEAIQPMQMIGPIGSFEIDGIQYNGIELADVVSYVSLLPKGTKELLIDFATPGGLKETGDSIYNYLMSLRPKMNITFNQVGPIGSIGTKIVFAGQNRIALDDGTDNWFIHNPWTSQSGDAASLRAKAEQMQPQEDELRNFYIQQTGITQEGIAPLMNAETNFNADKAVAMKFATSKRKALKIAAYNMKNEKTIGQRLDAIVALIAKSVTGGPLAMVTLNLEAGGAIAVDAADPTKLEGMAAFTCDATGQPTTTPAADGDYELDDDRIVSVTGGKVTKVSTEAAPAPPAAANQNGILQQIAALVAAAQKEPAKQTSLALDLSKVLATAKPTPTKDDDDKSNAALLAFLEKIEPLLLTKEKKDEQADVLALVDKKLKEALGKITSPKKPAIKAFKKSEDYMSPVDRYLQS